ncbi:MAG TPA: hypothetical protein VEX40_18235 [Mycobacterium sp.]|nr:hypothetical protein [Mycobacterium sp.]
MSNKFRLFAALLGASALVGAVGVDVAQAGTYPKGGSYHVGGEGGTIEPAPDPTLLSTASFAPQVKADIGCGTIAWGGGCG